MVAEARFAVLCFAVALALVSRSILTPAAVVVAALGIVIATPSLREAPMLLSWLLAAVPTLVAHPPSMGLLL